ncbi:MAG: YjbE family putative metal transport protein, partial [Nevskiales bacterium]
MGPDNFIHYLQLILEVFFVNLLLSGDNAVMIALACRSLPPAMTRRAMLLGIEAAIAMRVLLTAVASLLMRIPLLQLAGGVALTVIAIRLTIERQGGTKSDPGPPSMATDLWSAVGTIFVADLVMSVDNVVALAAVAQGSLLILTIGLLMSVPFLLYGSLFVTALLQRYPLLKRGGGAMLGWLAGDIAISDPMVAGWVNQQSPALTVVVPILVVIYVLYQSRIMESTQAGAQMLRPKPRQKPISVEVPPAAAAAAIPAPKSAPTPALGPAPEAAPAPEPALALSPLEKKRFRPLLWIIAGIY